MKHSRLIIKSGLKSIFLSCVFILALAGCSDSGSSVENRAESISRTSSNKDPNAYEDDIKKFRAVVEAQEKENERRAAESKREYEELLEREKQQKSQ